MTGMAWLYEASPSFQYAGIPRPAFGLLHCPGLGRG